MSSIHHLKLKCISAFHNGVALCIIDTMRVEVAKRRPRDNRAPLTHLCHYLFFPLSTRNSNMRESGIYIFLAVFPAWRVCVERWHWQSKHRMSEGSSHGCRNKESDNREPLCRMVSCGGTENRCKVECGCQHPSSNSGHPASIGWFKQTSVMGRAKNSRHYNELSLWIVKVHLDTAAGLHLAPACNPTHNTLSYSRRHVCSMCKYSGYFGIRQKKVHVIQFEMHRKMTL